MLMLLVQIFTPVSIYLAFAVSVSFIQFHHQHIFCFYITNTCKATYYIPKKIPIHFAQE